MWLRWDTEIGRCGSRAANQPNERMNERNERMTATSVWKQTIFIDSNNCEVIAIIRLFSQDDYKTFSVIITKSWPFSLDRSLAFYIVGRFGFGAQRSGECVCVCVRKRKVSNSVSLCSFLVISTFWFMPLLLLAHQFIYERLCFESSPQQKLTILFDFLFAASFFSHLFCFEESRITFVCFFSACCSATFFGTKLEERKSSVNISVVYLFFAQQHKKREQNGPVEGVSFQGENEKKKKTRITKKKPNVIYSVCVCVSSFQTIGWRMKFIVLTLKYYCLFLWYNFVAELILTPKCEQKRVFSF